MSTAEYCEYPARHSMAYTRVLTVCSLLTAQVYLSPAYVEEQNSWLEIRRSVRRSLWHSHSRWALQ